MKQRHGLVLVDKAAGLTSHDVVAIARRRTGIRKIGHTGTLDPLATGLLVLCIGKATRLQSYLMNTEKVYEGTIQFGWATDSYDAAGAAVGDPTEASIERRDFTEMLAGLTGEIEQIPPRFSAKKIDGVRAYELARRGETPEMKPKKVTVSEFVITSVAGSVATFRVRCSAGTYVRSLAHDLGTMTGLGAHLQSLRRVSTGSYNVSDAITSDALGKKTAEEILALPHYQDIDGLDLAFESILIDRAQEARMLRGETVIVKPESDSLTTNDLVAIRGMGDELIAIATVAQVIRAGGGPVALQPKVVLKDSES
ncbi:MAG TPA: tRNA pseudouridine(55) synthase TruB [Thermoanaerobaculia bacterium]|nr:tRNA pseudouridine(55) synthase TruB [Thermoanaerobaculia bacterium]